MRLKIGDGIDLYLHIADPLLSGFNVNIMVGSHFQVSIPRRTCGRVRQFGVAGENPGKSMLHRFVLFLYRALAPSGHKGRTSISYRWKHDRHFMLGSY